MVRLTKIAAAALTAAGLGFAAAACQPHGMVPPAPAAAAPAAAMTVAEIRALVVGNTIVARDETRGVSRAEYFSPDGTVKLKAKPDSLGMSFRYDGTYYFNERDEFCMNYPTLPISRTEYCATVAALGDGRYELSDGGIYERILAGDRLDELD